eukprot:6192557-Pleurochrysis_carterae.AAC.1
MPMPNAQPCCTTSLVPALPAHAREAPRDARARMRTRACTLRSGWSGEGRAHVRRGQPSKCARASVLMTESVRECGRADGG